MKGLFPLIPLPKKCCDEVMANLAARGVRVPLIPLPKKCCDLSSDEEQRSAHRVSINSTSEEVL